MRDKINEALKLSLISFCNTALVLLPLDGIGVIDNYQLWIVLILRTVIKFVQQMVLPNGGLSVKEDEEE